jgi:rhamnose utilization protein RhaD (predicted bifunctional aldolase and dehydrogenase)
MTTREKNICPDCKVDSIPNFPYTFASGKKKYVAIAFPKTDLEWLAQHLMIWGEGEPYDFMIENMDIAKEVLQNIIEPAMMKLQKKNKVQRDAQQHALREKLVMKIASKEEEVLESTRTHCKGAGYRGAE